MRISDWSSDVCSSDLVEDAQHLFAAAQAELAEHAVDHDEFVADIEGNDALAAIGIDGKEGRKLALDREPKCGELAVVGYFGGLDSRRSEARRGGKECVGTCRSRWSRDH